MVNYDINYIHAIPIKSCKAEALVDGFNECYNVLRNNGFEADIVRRNNENSKLLIDYITTIKLTYKLASLEDHQTDYIERAIQTYKNHFISALKGVDPIFSCDCWDFLMPPNQHHTQLTLNLTH